MARNAANQVAFAEQGGIKAILEGLSAHQGYAAVQIKGCRALKNLAGNNSYNAANQLAIAEQGVIKAILEALNSHQGDAQVQKQGFWLLHNIGSSQLPLTPKW